MTVFDKSDRQDGTFSLDDFTYDWAGDVYYCPGGTMLSWKCRTSRRLRKNVEMLFAHLRRILKLDRLRLRGPNGVRDEFILAATAQNLRKLAKLVPMPNLRPA